MSRELFHLPASRALSREHGPFRLRRIRPGLDLPDQPPDDTGFGPLGLIDHARLSPGLVVGMHEHRNDEIVSYLRRGTLWHEDTLGARLPLDATHVAVMNAGAGLSHEESIPAAAAAVEMLQIFIRPRVADLPPRFQHQRLNEARSADGWRRLVAPEGEPAPAFVRNRVWLYDTFLARPGLLRLSPTTPGADAWLYVFSGAISVDGIGVINRGDSLRILGERPVEFMSHEPSELVALLVDREAPASRAGTLSG